jgi:hypothetical protein
VDRPEGRPVCPRPVGRPGLPADQPAVAAGPRVHPASTAAGPSPLGRPADAPALEKNLRRLRRLRRAHPGKVVEVWAQDEARFGLKPIARRVWSLKGHRPRCWGRMPRSMCPDTRNAWLSRRAPVPSACRVYRQ